MGLKRRRNSIVDFLKNFGRKGLKSRIFQDFLKKLQLKISHIILFYSLGVSTNVIRFIENVYYDANFIVWTEHELSDKFSMSLEVKQGCLLSPLLFALYLDDLHEFIGGGIKIDDLNIRLYSNAGK